MHDSLVTGSFCKNRVFINEEEECLDGDMEVPEDDVKRANKSPSACALFGTRKGEILRITIQLTSNGTTLKLQGNLGGPWVQNLERLWRRVRENGLHRPVRIDLTSLYIADRDGRRVLKGMHEDGVELMAEGSYMRTLIGEVTGEKRSGEMSNREPHLRGRAGMKSRKHRIGSLGAS
jgi:hypothetical protein